MTQTIPAAIVRALHGPKPTAANFKSTKFTPAETKAWFANHFLCFCSADFPRHHFTQRFYSQLIHTFGFIAHFDLTGYWTEYFTTTAGKVEFIEQVVQHSCYADPACTFSDVEREIIRRLRQADLLGFYRGRGRAERDGADRLEFARLKARFEPGQVPAPVPASSSPPIRRRAHSTTEASQLSFAIS